MIKRKIRSVQYRFRQYLFDRFGYPKFDQERISKAVFEKFLPRNPIIIDCGAHDGHDTTSLSNHFPKGVVHAFEPIPALFERLAHRNYKMKNVRFYNCALADRNGILDFHASEGKSDGSSSLLPPKSHLKDHPDTFFKK